MSPLDMNVNVEFARDPIVVLDAYIQGAPQRASHLTFTRVPTNYFGKREKKRIQNILHRTEITVAQRKSYPHTVFAAEHSKNVAARQQIKQIPVAIPLM